jgi:EthD domain
LHGIVAIGGRLRVIEVDRHEVIAPGASLDLIHRLSFLRRRADVAPATFSREWHGEHARLAMLMPGGRGYRQNLVVERQAVKGTPCPYDELPIDGVVELWFVDVDSLNAWFATPEGARTLAHRRDSASPRGSVP